MAPVTDNEPSPIDDLGHWEGTRFIYKVPVELPDGNIMKAIETAHMKLAEDITVEDVIYALAHSISAEPIEENDSWKYN
jgi:hypothetical protein